jgi:hypothetical protein
LLTEVLLISKQFQITQMPLTKNKSNISLRTDLGLELVQDQEFFWEWQNGLSEIISDAEKLFLDMDGWIFCG